MALRQSIDVRSAVVYLLRRRRRWRHRNAGVIRHLSSAAEVAGAEERGLAVVTDSHLRMSGRRDLAVHAGVRRLVDVAHHLRLFRQHHVVEERCRFVRRREDLLLARDLHSVVRVQTQIWRGRVVDDEVEIQQIVVRRLRRRHHSGLRRRQTGSGGQVRRTGRRTRQRWRLTQLHQFDYILSIRRGRRSCRRHHVVGQRVEKQIVLDVLQQL